MSKEKFAEKLVLLDDFARGLKARMHQMKKRFGAPNMRPAFLNDPALKKVLDSFVKSFPSEPSGIDKMAGYDQLALKNKEIMQELEPYYGLIGDVLDFKDHAFHLLNDLNSNVIQFKWEANPSLMSGYLNLFVNYIKILLMLGSIDDRKLVVSLYARCFQQQNSGQEPNLAKLRLFVAEYENPFKTIQNEFSSLGSRIGGLAMTYAKIRDLPVMRRDGLLNIIQNSSILPYALTDPELMKSSMFQEWLLYGCLFCPNELSSNTLSESLKSLLQDTWVTLVYRDETFFPHNEFEALFGWFKGTNKEISKVKKIPGEVIAAAITKAGASHREWRTVLKNEISNLYNLLSDKPGLIAPKLPMVLSVLHIGVTEVRWHFLHTDKTPPKKTKYREEDYSDPTVCELMYQITRLHGLVNLHQSTIRRFYSEFLKGSDLKGLEAIVSELSAANKLTEHTKGYLDAILADLNAFDPNSPKADFAALRLNWMRCEAQLSVIGTTHSIHNMKDLSYRMSLIFFHTRCVDKLQDVNDEHGSMRSLWWHHEALLSLYQQIIQSPALAYTWPAFIYICNQFSENAHRMLPGERAGLGKAAVETSQKLIMAACNNVTNLVGKLHQIHQELYQQGHPSRAAVPNMKKEKKKADTSKQPGVESRWTNSSMIVGVDSVNAVMNQLAYGFEEMRSGVIVFSIKVFPIEFLIDEVVGLIKKRVKTFCRTDDNIEKPSTMAIQFSSLIQAVSTLNAVVDIDLPQIIHDIKYENVVTVSVQDGCLLSWARAWYMNYIFKRLMTFKNVYYSPLNKKMYCDALVQIKPTPEEFIDMEEIKSLVVLLGPIGMKTFHAEIIRQIGDCADNMKKFLITNQHGLSELRNCYLKEDATGDALKKLKGIDEFCQAAIQLGCAIVSRQMISEATHAVMSQEAPLLVNAVEIALYPMNTYGYYDFIETDILAGDLGVPVGASDPLLTKTLSSFNSSTVDMAVWDLLPYAFAATFTSSYWKDAVYLPWAEAFNNNILMVTQSISYMIVMMQSISAKIHKDSVQLMAGDKLLKDSLTRFIDIASVMVLRTQAKNVKDMTVYNQLVFMDKFMALCDPFLKRDVLESRIPYGLIRYAYSVIHRQDEADAAAKKVGPDAVAKSGSGKTEEEEKM